ncbi:YjhX family toxin [Phenylobacterium sp.]|uniref:YjhX family toxin n=1 Tax=Phenylobacterium sp. TaxID=1871053 RepID=UPI002FD9F889
MNIPKRQQRTLHALAQGATIRPVRDARGHIIDVDCITGEGWRLTDCDLEVFKALRRRGFIASRQGGPYRITRQGLVNLRSQTDNRTTLRAW